MAPQRNPLFWIGLAIAGLILFIFFGANRNGLSGMGSEQSGSVMSSSELAQDLNGVAPEKTAFSPSTSLDNNSAINRNLSTPPGMGARKAIQAARKTGKPYALVEIFNQAKIYQEEGSLADAHLLFFFSAREGHLDSIMQMALMSDPTQFRADISLLDQADPVQSFKWYQKAALSGYQPAIDSIKNLRQWALDESKAGNPLARQSLLNLKE